MNRDTIIGICLGLGYAVAIFVVAWAVGMVKVGQPVGPPPSVSTAPPHIDKPRPPVEPLIVEDRGAKEKA